MSKYRNQYIGFGMLAISFFGFSFFYLIPFGLSFFYSIMDSTISKQFCGFANYMELFHNIYFLRGLKNTGLFLLMAMPINMMLSFVLAFFVRRTRKYAEVVGLIFLIPLAIPSATSAYFWQNFFAAQGTLNKFLSLFGISGMDWLDGEYSMLAMVFIYVWKNIGYNMTLFLSGLTNIPKQYYEYADVEGAGVFWKLRNVTFVYLAPTIFLVFIMSFVNSFKVFREIYLITGDYPPDHLYVLQHYMNNMFLTLNYPKLSSAVYVLTLIIVFMVFVIFRAERKVSENLHD